MTALRNLAILFVFAVHVLAPLAMPPAAAAQGVEFGKVVVQNDYNARVTVRLYHADALDQVFGSWTLDPNESGVLQIDGKEFTIGGDWLVRVQFANGAPSDRRLVYKVGTHGRGMWTIYASDVYGDK